MRLRTLAATILAIATLGVAAAQAEPAYSTADVNMRTGPDIDFPSVGVIPEGEPLYVNGCLRDESWCDAQWGPEHGWVYSEYLAFDYRGEMVLLPDVGPAYFRIPIITFEARDYWGRYYVGRTWYRDRDRWFAFRPRPASDGMPRPPVLAGPAGGVPDIRRRMACCRLRIGAGGDPSGLMIVTTGAMIVVMIAATTGATGMKTGTARTEVIGPVGPQINTSARTARRPPRALCAFGARPPIELARAGAHLSSDGAMLQRS